MEFILPKILLLYYVGIGVIVLGILMLLGLVVGRKKRLYYLFAWFLCCAIGILLIYVSSGSRVIIRHGEIELKVRLYQTKWIAADQIQHSKILELNRPSDLNPARKISGTWVGKQRTGWFRLKNKDKAFLVLEGSKGIFIGTKTGEKYIFGIQNFDSLKAVFEQRIKKIEAD